MVSVAVSLLRRFGTSKPLISLSHCITVTILINKDVKYDTKLKYLCVFPINVLEWEKSGELLESLTVL